MPAPSTLLRAARPAFRAQFFTSQSQAQSNILRQTRHRFQQATRRWQSTTAAGATETNLLKRLWNSPIGIKTVHFWAPIMKWCIVLAGISDFYRPAEKLSLTQNVALTATGAIWTRWCLIIKPKNIMLASVNFFLGLVGVVQVSRILMWNSSQKKLTAGQQIDAAKEGAVESAKGLKADVVEAVKS